VIYNLQVLRGVAALGVVIYHTDIRINGVQSDLMGVAIFFVISGFIMVHITRETDEDFLLKRLIRIVPLYWILTVAAMLWFRMGFANPPYMLPTLWNFLLNDPLHLIPFLGNQLLSFCTPQIGMALLRTLTFWPTAQNPMPILSVGWTLNIEMAFYFLFALALFAGRAVAPLLSGAVLIVLFRMEASGTYPSQVLATWGHNYVIYFVFGMIVFYLWSAIAPAVRSNCASAVVAALAILLYWPAGCFVFQQSWLEARLLPPSIVMALLVLHSAQVRIRSQFLVELGGASYSLYLVHIPVVETLRATASSFPVLTPSTPMGCAIAVVLSCSVAMISYRMLELPVLRVIRSRMSGQIGVANDGAAKAAHPIVGRLGPQR
jgi:exopolysaccharide production protein ExoZ